MAKQELQIMPESEKLELEEKVRKGIDKNMIYGIVEYAKLLESLSTVEEMKFKINELLEDEDIDTAEAVEKRLWFGIIKESHILRLRILDLLKNGDTKGALKAEQDYQDLFTYDNIKSY